ncbi:MAG: gamma-glutamyl-gamma-aminobutyrate hydrolase family protein [Alphaproteobacteria bacterium]|jgi:putative glutamine amidotransferase|nr:gamma-glutamyl-gamma-aminobutyrate hydrolase family protein [Alphaproteobacteria bacterium]MBT5389389.1 gamma-glutamyl-gamma-aminobutyrate hydrolase family protein [Alphaproteobacteria bacterium]MBT5655148.1 gamma-glutamyl-gamma-aminobutyrate hydrolase family protein [Alphaproteobacteria bacterium]
MKTLKPIIGLTCDHVSSGGYSKYPWYALRENYCTSISKIGGMPVPLTHSLDLVDKYLDLVDGLIITGGDFDIDPSLFGDDTVHPRVQIKKDRTLFELALTKGALERNMPILGICGGHQILNVALGGSLIQHIPDDIPEALAHEQPNPRHEPGHSVTIEPNTLLKSIVQQETIMVNSAHHQAVKSPGNSLIVNAYATDGVIEGIEEPKYEFCLGVQWHPEYEISPADNKIFAHLVKASS